ncbi:MAG: EAL domain-containing protein [Gammaproteobacteria bacterium]|nr:EAL domain-containing protein [Gammaproteobacteria bacterium]
MARPRQQVKSRILTTLALSTLVPMIVFGYIAHTSTVNASLERAYASLREDSKTYALTLLERLQTYAGVDARHPELTDHPELAIDLDRDVVIVGAEKLIAMDDWLWDIDDTTAYRCVIIDGATHRCGGTPIDDAESLAQDWELFLEGNFAPSFSLSVRTMSTEQQVLQSLSLIIQLYPVLALLISLTVCGIAYRFLGRRLEPLHQLEIATAAIAKGEYGAEVEVASGDEFESLAAAFNEMSRTLETSFQRLNRLADIDRMILASTDLDEIISRALEVARAEGYQGIELFLWRQRPSPIAFVHRYENDKVTKERLKVSDFAPVDVWHDVDAMEARCRKACRIEKPIDCFPLFIDDQTCGFLLVNGESALNSTDYATVDLVDKMAVAVTNGWRSEDLFRQAHFDRLTGLINRPAFEDRLSYALAQAKRRQTTGALLFMDLDRFKQVNDTEGHKAGDRLLVMVAHRLRGCLRDEDTVARFGGDEFGVLVSQYADQAELVSICDRIIQAIRKPIVVDHIEHVVNVSIGAAIFPDDADAPDELLMLADAAMYRAKEVAGGSASFYDKALNEAAHARVVVESRLRNAVKDKRLKLHFQPIMDLKTGRLPSAEGLMRWDDEELGSVPPARFVSVAEDTGIIHEFLDVCMSEVSKTLRRLISRGMRDYRIAINASPKQLSKAEFGKRFLETCARHDVSPNNLELEFTESIFVNDPTSVKRELAIIRDQGVVIALDDFGTGYSSLNMLRQLPIDVLKIDRSFIKDVESSRDALDLVHHVIDIAQVLKKEVVAEGVETGEQFAVLKKVGCQFIQGYFVSPPLPSSEFLNFIAEHEMLRTQGYRETRSSNG